MSEEHDVIYFGYKFKFEDKEPKIQVKLSGFDLSSDEYKERYTQLVQDFCASLYPEGFEEE